MSPSEWLHTHGNTGPDQIGPPRGWNLKSKEQSLGLHWSRSLAGKGQTSRGITIKREQSSCFVNGLCLAPSELKVAGHFSSLAALELHACQLSQLNPITASSISFGPMEHSLITSPKISIIPTKAPHWPYPKEFSRGAAWNQLFIDSSQSCLQLSLLLAAERIWEPAGQSQPG